MDLVINLIIIVAYAVVIVAFLINHIKVFKTDKDRDADNIENHDPADHSVPFYLVRNQYFPTMEYSVFFINEFMVEAFNIFINVVPTMISTLSKAERRVSAIRTEIGNKNINEEDIRDELKEINPILTELMEASHSLIAKLEEVSSNVTENNITQVQLDPKSVEIYTSAVNMLMQLTDDHSLINSSIHLKLAEVYPDLVTPFRVVSGKLAYTYFVLLITYSNKLEENIFIYN